MLQSLGVSLFETKKMLGERISTIEYVPMQNNAKKTLNDDRSEWMMQKYVELNRTEQTNDDNDDDDDDDGKSAVSKKSK